MPFRLVAIFDVFALIVLTTTLVMGFFSYGGVTERGGAVIALGGILLALTVAARLGPSLLDRSRPLRLAHSPGPALVFWGLFLGWGALQIAPLPESLIAFVSPRTAAWNATFSVLDGHASRLSLDPAASGRALAQLVFLTLTALAVAQICVSATRRDIVTILFLVWMAAAAVYAFLELAGVVGDTRGWRVLSGPLINRNHFATLMAMAAPVSAGWVLTLVLRRARAAERHGQFFDWHSIFNSNLILLIFLPFLFAGACLLTLSRGGVAAMATGLLIFLGLVTRGGGVRLAITTSAGVVGLIFIVLMATGVEPLTERFEDLSETVDAQQDYSRGQIWGDSVLIAADFPVFGSGLGSFYGVYMPYSSVDTTRLPIHAHSDWLQTLVETGFVGLALVMCAAAIFLWRGVRRLGRVGQLIEPRRHQAASLESAPNSSQAPAQGTIEQTERPLFAGILAGIVAVMLHSLADFSLRIPLVAFLFALLIGLSLASGDRPGGRRRRKRTHDENVAAIRGDVHPLQRR